MRETLTSPDGGTAMAPEDVVALSIWSITLRVMRRTIVQILALLLPVLSAAQGTGVIAGRIHIDAGEPAAGANVVLLETRFGAAVGTDGGFSIADLPEGEFRLQVRLIGYEDSEVTPVRVRSGDTSRVDLTLHQRAVELGTVVITGTRRQDASDTRPSVTTMSPREAKTLPGAAEDVLRSLQALPGVTSVSDFSSQLVIRGSGPDQNLILIDGFEVLNPYRLYGFVSMFNPETVSEISLQTGGFAAQYGDRLSAVLDVRNREGRTESWTAGKANVSLTNMNLIVDGGLSFLNRDASYLVSFRRTYYDLILGPVLKSARLVKGDVALPNFRDLQVKVALPLGGPHKLLLNAFTSRDGVELMSGAERDTPDSINIFDKSFNTLLGATWQLNPSQDLVAQTQVSWYRNTGDGLFDGTFVDPAQNTGNLGRLDTTGIRLFRFAVDYDYIYEKSSLAQRVLWSGEQHAIEVGYGVDMLRTDFIRYFQVDESFQEFLRSRGQVVPTDAVETVRYNRFNAYLQDRIAIGDRFFVQPGLRLDYYPVLHRSVYVAPRLNVSYKLDELSTIRAAVGTYYQSPGMEKQDFRLRLSFSRGNFSTLNAERADHVILGFDRMVSPEWQFKVETYYKRFRDIVVSEKLPGSQWHTARTGANVFTREGWTAPVRVAADSVSPRPVNDAKGISSGVEVLLQKLRTLPGDRFTGWVGYALSFSERDRHGVISPFLFDQRHAVNVVGNYRFAERWDIGARFTLRSGRPFAQALGVKPRVVYQRVNGVDIPVVQVDPNGRVILDVEYERDAYRGRLNLYHSLDVRVTTYPRWWGLDWSFYLDVENVYNRENQQQLSYYVDTGGNLRQRAVNGIPFLPSV
jgi:hypothetical protein